MKLNKKQIQHIYWRAGFGPDPIELAALEGQSLEFVVSDLFEKSMLKAPLQMDLRPYLVDPRTLSQEEKKKLRIRKRKDMHELNVLWMEKMATTQEVLREKMTFFFHDHFAVRNQNPKMNVEFNNLLRTHALGDFGELLLSVAKFPAMLLYLNNRQNVKDHPNENFGREVLELFTLGRDNVYTEQDIKEAARSFTGWNFDKEGNFMIRKKLHDDGVKTFLGRTGNLGGEDIIQILLEERQTAKYLTEKLIDFFIGIPISEERVTYFADLFYDAKYDLSKLVHAILTAPEFMDEASIGCKIKSPTEFLVGMMRLCEVDFKKKSTLIQLQRKLNQELFFPPNVAGWAGGRSWIDNSTLMLRMKAPSMVLSFGVIEWDEKGDMPEAMLLKLDQRRKAIKKRTEKKIGAYPNWGAYETKMKNENHRLQEFLIQPELSAGAKRVLEVSDSTTLQDRTIEIMSLPEYQLC